MLNSLLYVTDSGNNRVQSLNPTTGTYQGQFGGPGATPGRFNWPTNIASMGERLLVTDTFNRRVQQLNAVGRFLTSFGDKGPFNGLLAQPAGIAAVGEEQVYVADVSRNLVKIYSRTE